MTTQVAIGAAILGLLVMARRLHVDLVSPAMLFAVVWLAALLGATFPPFGIDDWSTQVWLVMIVAPFLLVVGATIATGRTSVSRQPLALTDVLSTTDERTAWGLLAATIVGGTVFLIEFVVAGGVPLFSGRADELRMQLVFSPLLHLVTRLVPVSVMLALVLVPRARGRALAILLVAVAIGSIVLAMQAARLEVVTVAGIVGIAALLVYRLNRRVVVGIGAFAVVMLIFVSSVFLFRLPQNPSTRFENELLNDVVPSRGPLFAWTVPVQVGVSSGVWVMGRLVITDALASAPGNGLYMLYGYDRFLPARDSSAVAVTVTSPLIAPTYLADPYGDFGLAGAAVFSLLLGVIAGVSYRRAVRRQTLFAILSFAYVTYWVLFGIYVNIWTYYAFWIVDLAILYAGCRIVSRQIDMPSASHLRAAHRDIRES